MKVAPKSIKHDAKATKPQPKQRSAKRNLANVAVKVPDSNKVNRASVSPNLKVSPFEQVNSHVKVGVDSDFGGFDNLDDMMANFDKKLDEELKYSEITASGYKYSQLTIHNYFFFPTCPFTDVTHSLSKYKPANTTYPVCNHKTDFMSDSN